MKESSYYDRVEVARQNSCRVFHCLASSYLNLAGVQVYCLSAELMYSRLEGYSRTGGCLLKEEPDALSSERVQGGILS